MEEQHPNVLPKKAWSDESTALSAAISGLAATRPWILFFGIAQLIGLGVHVLCMLNLFEDLDASPEALYVVGVLELVFIIISVYTAIKLFVYADSIQEAARDPSLRRVAIAIRAQWHYWRFLGLTALAVLLATAVGAGVLFFS